MADDFERIKANVHKMIGMQAPAEDIDGYLKQEGWTPENFRAVATQSPDQQAVSNIVTAPGFGASAVTAGVNASDAANPPSDPGFVGRLGQYADRNVAGKILPPLKENAGTGSKIADAIERGRDYLVNLENTIQRGLSFGASDEVGALGTTIRQSIDKASQPQTIAGLVKQKILNQEDPGFWQRFAENDRRENAAIDKFKQENPIIGNTAEIAGMITSPIGNIGGRYIQAGPNMAMRAARAAGVGAGLGGASGFLNSEGDLNDRLKSAAFGSGTGAVIGGTVTPLIETLARGGKYAYDMYQNIRRANTSPDEQARYLLAQALMRDNVSPQQAAANLQSGQAQSVLDAAGPNTVALGRQATVAPGNAQEAAATFLEGRQADQAGRFQAALAPIGNGTGFQNQLDTLIQQRAQSARPLYEALEGIDPERLDTPFFRNLLQSGPGNQLLGRARQIAALEQARGATPVNLMEPLLDAEGNLRTATIPNFRAMDYVKQAADDMVAQYTDPVTGRIQGPVGHQWDQLRRAIVGNLDEAAAGTGANGENLYQAARNAYAGPSRMIEAMNEGRQFFSNGRAEDAIAAFNQLPQAEQDAFRIGAANDLIGKLGNKADGNNAYNLIANSPNKRSKLQALFPDEATFNRFLEMAGRENTMFRNAQKVMGGSPTASRLAEQADAAQSLQQLNSRLTALRQLLTWHPIQAATTFATQAGNLQRGMSEPVANELGRILFNPNQAQGVQALQSLGGTQVNPGLIQALINQQTRNQQLGQFGNALITNAAGKIGGAVGGAVTR